MSNEKSFLTREEAEDFAGKSGTVTPVGTAFVAVKGGKAAKDDESTDTKPGDIKSVAESGDAVSSSK